jgi:transposase-like protein
MENKRSQYTKDYKVEAFCLILEEGDPFFEVAGELGVASSLLHRWKISLRKVIPTHFQGKGV